MPYVASQDPYKTADFSSSPSKNLTLITPADSDLTGDYPKALRVYSASGCTVRVTPANAPSDATTYDFTFPAGAFVEPVVVRRVWTTGTTGSPIIHGYQD